MVVVRIGGFLLNQVKLIGVGEREGQDLDLVGVGTEAL